MTLYSGALLTYPTTVLGGTLTLQSGATSLLGRVNITGSILPFASATLEIRDNYMAGSITSYGTLIFESYVHHSHHMHSDLQFVI